MGGIVKSTQFSAHKTPLVPSSNGVHKFLFCHPGNNSGHRANRKDRQGSQTTGIIKDLGKLREESIQEHFKQIRDSRPLFH
ncbi:MAG: hypothetical protein CO103_05825 [Chloroflexi bacterium CG_4_9_14_3_um_filter_45_9]|nr:MAG: hypothetical protein AUK00_00370 [Dehalococcoidia bacterium CG2_30_46_9]PIU22755.1 MAG: hypothetical protein COT13_06625 [Chloroflexi bacterium CG08_land_8_20_14_0_20_45_12]PIX26949.1 MAG: hypothetical protein COZ67_04805 [Chloroflexi bacterium CG_4_8_14_3_um_filter_45_15]PJB49396.1 MAG: hypothetical protein CO103_05825 [Chloroflexi bacterium CG_4_9_14_3_um_filter_45_9]